MAIIRYRGIGASGVVKDYAPVDNANVLTIADNVRHVGSSIQTDYGLSAVPNLGGYWMIIPINYNITGNSGSIVQSVFWVAQKSAQVEYAPGKLYALDYVENTTFAYFNYPNYAEAPALTGVVIAGVPIIGGYRIPPLYSSDPDPASSAGSGMAPLPWDVATGSTWVSVHSGKGASAGVFRSYLNYALALSTIENDTHYPTRLRWSDSVLPGTVPQSWEDTRLDVDAGYKDFDDTPGEVLDCAPMGSVNVVYKDDSVWAQEYNSSPSVFSFRKLFSFGIYATNCVQEFDGRHFVITKNDIIVHDGASFKSVIDDRVRGWFDFSTYAIARHRFGWGMFTIKDAARNTIYVFGKDLDVNTRSCAFAYNYVTNTWTRRPMPDGMRALSAAISRPEYYSTIGYDLLVSCGGWNGDGTGPTDAQYVYRMNDSTTLANRAATVKMSNVPLSSDATGALRSDPWQEKKIHRLYPLLRNVSPSTAVITVTVSGRNDYADTSNTWAITSSVTASQLRWLNIDKVAREIDIQIDSTSATWELHGIDVDVDKVGRY